MLKQVCFRIAFVTGVGIMLSGCVNVRTTIHTNGAITKQVSIQVESSHEALVWQEIQQNLARPQPGWVLDKSRQGPNTLILATQSLPDTNLAHNTSLTLERTGWTSRRYTYRERIPLGQYAATPSAKAVAASMPVAISLQMPGHITDAPGSTVSSNLATWNYTLAEEGIVIQATSSQSRYCTAVWTVIAFLLALAAVAAWLKEKFSR